MPRVRYWNTERLCNLAACLRKIATEEDGKLAIRGTKGLGVQVATTYWKEYDSDVQLIHIMKALAGLGAAGVLDSRQAKVRGVEPVRYILSDPDETKRLIESHGPVY